MTNFKDILKKLVGSSADSNLEWNHTSGKTFEEQQRDLGVFHYTSDGFTYTRSDFSKFFYWSDITELNVFKRDLMTIDEIWIEIVFGDKYIEITEDVPGWYQFILKTKEIFPTIPKDWDTEIVHPPFATNFRTIYSKTNVDRKY